MRIYFKISNRAELYRADTRAIGIRIGQYNVLQGVLYTLLLC